MRVQLSPHFHLDEFDPHDGGSVPPGYVPALTVLCVDLLEPMRRIHGTCRVVSGYRTVSHNKAVGGAPDSHHLYQRHHDSPAADVAFARGTAAQWYATADLLLRTRGGVGRYAGHVHVDLRSQKTRW